MLLLQQGVAETTAEQNVVLYAWLEHITMDFKLFFH